MTDAGSALPAVSPYRVTPGLVRAVALVKEAAAICNGELGYLSPDVVERIVVAARALHTADDRTVGEAVELDAFQGGAGTAINMAVNRWIAESAGPEAAPGAQATAGAVPAAPGGPIDPYAHVNCHQSTNDVMPTALRLLMHDQLSRLERSVEELQAQLQAGEERYDMVLKPARTQLRDAVVTTVGREFATWAHAIGRDRWRCFKARERIREVNLGGTAVGTGAGAPRRYVLQVVQVLQRLTSHPVCRAEHLVEATSNWDQVVEAMESVRTLAVNLRRIANDIRLLASGPETAIGEMRLPRLMRGSSIMAGKVNPVVPESVIQVAERIIANDGLITRLAASTELELNAFFPALAFTIEESLTMARGATEALCDYVSRLEVDHERCAANVAGSAMAVVALLPLVPYGGVEVLLRAATEAGQDLHTYLIETALLSESDSRALFAPENVMSLGYDESLYAEIHERSGAVLAEHVEQLGGVL